MSLSGIQKITLLSCLVLSMALFLPKLFSSAVKDKEVLHSEAVGPGRLHGRGPCPGEDQGTRRESLYTTRPNPGSFPQTRPPQKAKLLGRVAPVYGFGIFLFIVYILCQFSRRDPRTAQRRSFSITTPEHTDQDLPEDEMSELKTRIKQMDGQRERRTSKSFQNPARCHKYRDGHLRKITYMLVEEHPLEDVTPEVEAEETPYSADWE
ncbi:protein RIC-3, partial [Clarias magur]